MGLLDHSPHLALHGAVFGAATGNPDDWLRRVVSSSGPALQVLEQLAEVLEGSFMRLVPDLGDLALVESARHEGTTLYNQGHKKGDGPGRGRTPLRSDGRMVERLADLLGDEGTHRMSRQAILVNALDCASLQHVVARMLSAAADACSKKTCQSCEPEDTGINGLAWRRSILPYDFPTSL